MGLFTSLLCCTLDAKDDSEDKDHKSSSRGANSPASPKSPASKSSNKPAASSSRPELPAENSKPKDKAVPLKEAAAEQNNKNGKKDLLDDENSVNETDTITNTNEELNPTPTLNTNTQLPPMGENPILNIRPEDEAQQAQMEAQIAADVQEQLSNSSDPESEFDLTKLQEGQAFNPETGFLLGRKNTKKFGNKKCLILDLDETLVHSSFKYLRTADFVIPVEIDNQVHHVYVIKRPGVDEFLEKVGKWFEVVVFTASVSKDGDPLLNKLDIHRSVHHRLFRDSCYNYQGNFIKNLSQIGRPLSECIIIDNSPASYIFHPEHSIPISSWFSDTHDNELLDLLPFLEDISKPNVDDVSKVLDIGL